MVGKILAVFGVLVLILIAVIFFSIQSAQNEPPPQILANFTPPIPRAEVMVKFK